MDHKRNWPTTTIVLLNVYANWWRWPSETKMRGHWVRSLNRLLTQCPLMFVRSLWLTLRSGTKDEPYGGGWGGVGRGAFQNTLELLNLKALEISTVYKNCIIQCMGKIFCVEFQRYPLKFHTKYFTNRLEDIDFIHMWKFKRFKSSLVFLKCPTDLWMSCSNLECVMSCRCHGTSDGHQIMCHNSIQRYAIFTCSYTTVTLII